MGDLLANETCVMTVRGWLMANNEIPLSNRLTLSSRIPQWRALRSSQTLRQITAVAKFMRDEDFARLNKRLCRIRK